MLLSRRGALAAPAILGLAGCAGGGGSGTVGLVQGRVPDPNTAWNQLPPAVRDAFTRNPALAGLPAPGIASLTSAVRFEDGKVSLADRQFTQVGGLMGVRLSLRSPTFTFDNLSLSLQQPASNFVVADLRWAPTTETYNTDGGQSYSIAEIRAEGRFPARKGDERSVTWTKVALDSSGQPTGARSEQREQVKVEQSYSVTQLWNHILRGQFSGTVRPWLLAEPSFLMGTHHYIRARVGNGVTSLLLSDLYGLPALFWNGTGWQQLNFFGQGSGTDIRLAGERMTLSAAGLARQREARAELDAEVFLRAARGSALPQRGAAAAAQVQEARQLVQQGWASGNLAAARAGLERALLQDNASAPVMLLYADVLRRSETRPSLRAAAADRLAVLYARVALTLEPEGPTAAAAREMMAQLPRI